MRATIALSTLVALAGCELMLDWKQAEYVGPSAGRDAGRDAALPPGPDATTPGLDAASLPDAQIDPIDGGPGVDAATAGPDFFAVWGESEARVWAVGAHGAIRHWNGSQWLVEDVPGVSTDLHGIWGQDSTSILAVGDSNTVLRYDGTSWQVEGYRATTADLKAVDGYFLIDAMLVGTRGTLLHHKSDPAVDGGYASSLNCNADKAVCPDIASSSLYGVAVLEAPSHPFWLVGDGIFRREASGLQQSLEPDGGPTLLAVAANKLEAYAVGVNGAMYHLPSEVIPDGGSHTVGLLAVPVDSTLKSHLFGAWINAAGSELRAVGNGGKLVCCALAGAGTTCGGCTSSRLATTGDLRAIWGVKTATEAHYFAVGMGGALHHWTE